MILNIQKSDISHGVYLIINRPKVGQSDTTPVFLTVNTGKTTG